MTPMTAADLFIETLAGMLEDDRVRRASRLRHQVQEHAGRYWQGHPDGQAAFTSPGRSRDHGFQTTRAMQDAMGRSWDQ